MKVAHIAPICEERITGPRNSVTTLSAHMNGIDGVESEVFSVNSSKEFIFNDQVVRPASTFKPYDIDLCVFSGLYIFDYLAIAGKLRDADVPYVISPRSSLMKASFRKSAARKAAFLVSSGRRYVKGASALHFLTEEEAKNSFDFSLPIIVSGNGVATTSDFEVSRKKRIITFMGRFDITHKGLDRLVKALDDCATELRRNGWIVKMCGPEFRGGRAWVTDEVARRELSDIVFVQPEVSGKDKVDLLKETSVFVHSSRYEGQPQSVMEAMAYGCAIIVTPGTNMISASQYAGWASTFDTESLSSSIKSAISSNADIGKKMNAAFSHARENFSWRDNCKLFIDGLHSIVG
jgi:glycosyltransferase involved in cell wall biosynthesis